MPIKRRIKNSDGSQRRPSNDDSSSNTTEDVVSTPPADGQNAESTPARDTLGGTDEKKSPDAPTSGDSTDNMIGAGITLSSNNTTPPRAPRNPRASETKNTAEDARYKRPKVNDGVDKIRADYDTHLEQSTKSLEAARQKLADTKRKYRESRSNPARQKAEKIVVSAQKKRSQAQREIKNYTRLAKLSPLNSKQQAALDNAVETYKFANDTYKEYIHVVGGYRAGDTRRKKTIGELEQGTKHYAQYVKKLRSERRTAIVTQQQYNRVAIMQYNKQQERNKAARSTSSTGRTGGDSQFVQTPYSHKLAEKTRPDVSVASHSADSYIRNTSTFSTLPPASRGNMRKALAQSIRNIDGIITSSCRGGRPKINIKYNGVSGITLSAALNMGADLDDMWVQFIAPFYKDMGHLNVFPYKGVLR